MELQYNRYHNGFEETSPIFKKVNITPTEFRDIYLTIGPR